MSFTLVRFIHTSISRNHGFPIMSPKKKLFTTAATSTSQKSSEERLVVVGGGAAGVYGAIRAKTVAPNLDVVIIEKGKPLSKVKISGGGRCNVTNGHCLDKMIHTKKRNRLEHQRLNALVYVRYNTRLRERSLQRKQNVDPILVEEIDSDDEWIAEKEDPLLPLDLCWLQDNELFNVDAIRVVSSNSQETQASSDHMVSSHSYKRKHNEVPKHYPRGNKEFRGSFFSMHGPVDTMSWFSDHGVNLKTEDDGRVFPVSNSSSSVIECLMSEMKKRRVLLQTGKVVTTVSTTVGGKFLLKIEKRTINSVEYLEADYLLIASGSSRQGYTLATQLGHSIIDPVPSLFTFKIEDPHLAELSGVTFHKVKANLKLDNVQKNKPQLSQVGPMLVTHWGFSGPVILRLSAWGARDLFNSGYRGILLVDFTPDLHIEDVKTILIQHKDHFAKQKVLNSCPSKFGLVKRFWKYILDREGLDGNILWASISNNSLYSVASLLKHCSFGVTGKGIFKDEFVTAGGVPLSEISLNTMESRIQSHLFFAGEVLNVDGVTGGFNFQNAWTGGYIAGTSIGKLALDATLEEVI